MFGELAGVSDWQIVEELQTKVCIIRTNRIVDVIVVLLLLMLLSNVARCYRRAIGVVRNHIADANATNHTITTHDHLLLRIDGHLLHLYGRVVDTTDDDAAAVLLLQLHLLALMIAKCGGRTAHHSLLLVVVLLLLLLHGHRLRLGHLHGIDLHLINHALLLMRVVLLVLLVLLLLEMLLLLLLLSKHLVHGGLLLLLLRIVHATLLLLALLVLLLLHLQLLLLLLRSHLHLLHLYGRHLLHSIGRNAAVSTAAVRSGADGVNAAAEIACIAIRVIVVWHAKVTDACKSR